MTVKINELFNIPGSVKSKKRVGRGIASGKGKTCGRGHKGQKSRSGVSIKTEGGQMPLIKRLPKRGFHSAKSISYKIINTDDLLQLLDQKKIDITKEIDKDVLYNAGLIKNKNSLVKLLLGSKKVNDSFVCKFDAYSSTAKIAIESSGGKIYAV